MARMWKSYASKAKGIPPRIIFYVNNPLDLPGLRWAPRSLLSSAKHNLAMDIDIMVDRFNMKSNTHDKPGTLATIGDRVVGLRVCYPGCIVRVKPLRPDLPLHPWHGVLKRGVEDYVLIRDINGRWFTLLNRYRTLGVMNWTDEEKRAYDQRVQYPLCQAIDTGRCALIYDGKSKTSQGSRACLLVELLPNVGVSKTEYQETENVLQVRSLMAVTISAVSAAEETVYNNCRAVTETMAEDQSTKNLLELYSKHRKMLETGNTANDEENMKKRTAKDREDNRKPSKEVTNEPSITGGSEEVKDKNIGEEYQKVAIIEKAGGAEGDNGMGERGLSEKATEAVHDEIEAARKQVRTKFIELMARNWATQPEFVQSAHDAFAPDMKEYIWAMALKRCSHDMIIEELPEDQCWIVD